ncbi:MAG: ZIP family metal transporter [Clostridia bacterium]|nr:ZIP family metal transporter [Clostridia bacterium]
MIFWMLFPFLTTVLGSLLVYFFKNDNTSRVNAVFFGLSSGIMVAASVWSLLMPALNASAFLGKLAFVPVVVGLLLGGIFIVIADTVAVKRNKKGLSSAAKLFLAVTMHNVPEGLAVGFSFGSENVLAAVGLSIGIGVQNLPEGAAVSFPLCSEGVKKNKAFLLGALSGIVEPIFAVIGYFLAGALKALQPWLLAFSAGAMLLIVAEDLLPDTEEKQTGALAFLLGFALMMSLDVALA